MGGLLHLVQRRSEWAGMQPAQALLAVPDVTVGNQWLIRFRYAGYNFILREDNCIYDIYNDHKYFSRHNYQQAVRLGRRHNMPPPHLGF